MSIVTLTDNLQYLTLEADAFVPFKPLVESPRGHKALHKALSDVPRYLFRVYTPCSDGRTDQSWAKSRDADSKKVTATEDIFDNKDRRNVAAMINRHLRWCNTPDDSDNLVSWTSSLLFAIQYIFYRHTQDKTDLSQIMLCIIDTTKFNNRIFIRDLDLIDHYSSFNFDLRNLSYLRTKKHKTYSGSYYFGEYLSQGALEIEGKCRTVSAREVVDNGLFKLQPEFETSMNLPGCNWANEVIRLREAFLPGKGDVEEEQILAALRIGQIFGSCWQLPVAANFLTLLPLQGQDEGIANAFRNLPAIEREECSPLTTKVIAYDTMPELVQLEQIMQRIWTDLRFARIDAHLQKAECSIRNATIDLYSPTACIGQESERLFLHRVDTIEFLIQSLRDLYATKTD